MRITLHTDPEGKNTPYSTARKAYRATGAIPHLANEYLSRKKEPYIWEGGKLERLEVK